MSCSGHSQSVMCHPLSTICYIQGFSGIFSKTLSEFCSFYNEAKDVFLYILDAFRVAVEEVKFREVSIPSFERGQKFLTYNNVTICKFFCRKHSYFYYTHARKLE